MADQEALRLKIEAELAIREHVALQKMLLMGKSVEVEGFGISAYWANELGWAWRKIDELLKAGPKQEGLAKPEG